MEGSEETPNPGPQIAMFVRSTFWGHLLVLLFIFGLQLIYQTYGRQINTDGHWIMRVMFGTLAIVTTYQVFRTSSLPTRVLLTFYTAVILSLFMTSIVVTNENLRYMPTLSMVGAILLYILYFSPARHINNANSCLPSSQPRQNMFDAEMTTFRPR